jgi:Protein of unknown function (DUF2795)
MECPRRPGRGFVGRARGERVAVNRAELEVSLEGVPLPAARSELVRYAAAHGAPPDAIEALTTLPDREFGSLDEVGEELAPVQPGRPEPEVRSPHEESGGPPGGERYTLRP